MARAAGIAWKVLVVVGIVAYQVVVHLGIAGRALDPARTALLLAPMAALACWILWRSQDRLVWALIFAASAGALFLLERGPAALYGVPHAAAYLSLLWLFGRTLARGREPFVTRLARFARDGALAPAMESYTRRLTLAWCVFFAAQLAASALLLRFGSVENWSLFINVLNFPLVALMFLGDYLYRVVRYRDSSHSIAHAVRAYARDRASSLLSR